MPRSGLPGCEPELVTDTAGAALQVLISKEPTVAGRVAAHVADLEDELALLKQLDHPNIVRYLVRFLPSHLHLSLWSVSCNHGQNVVLTWWQ